MNRKKRKRVYLIGGSYYQLDNVKFDKIVGDAITEFQDNKTEKGAFWIDLKKKTDASKSTVEGWRHGNNPRYLDQLLKVINYLGCEKDEVLVPIAYKRIATKVTNIVNNENNSNIINEISSIIIANTTDDVDNEIIDNVTHSIGDEAISNTTNSFKNENVVNMADNVSEEKIANGDRTIKNKEIEGRVDYIISKKRELNIGFFGLLSYLTILKGYQISIVFLIMILRKKIIPSDRLCKEIEDFLDMIEKNRTCNKINPISKNPADIRKDKLKRDQCIANRTRIQHLNLQYKAIAKYMDKIKNYQLNALDLWKMLYGFSMPSDVFLQDLEVLLDIISKNTMDDLFPLSENEKIYAIDEISISQSCAFAKSIPIIFTVGENKMLKREDQIRKIKNYAQRYKISLDTTYIHTYRDNYWYECKKAFDLVEKGYYDSILLNKHNDIESQSFLKRITQYAVTHNIPIVYVEEQYYIK